MKGDKSFVDHIRIRCKSGDGGNGIVSFRREKFVPRGGPDGGDGGDGGQVVIKVDENTDNLRAFHYDPKLIAENGAQGQTYKRHGKNGKTAIGRVPPGTVIYKSPAVTVTDAVAMERSEDGIDLEPVIDLTEHGQEVTLCVGGKGGRGNFHFRTATNQVPQEREMGTDGSEGIYYLELRRIADAGLVGFPKAIGRVPPGTVIYKSPAVTVTDAVAMERSEDGIDLEPVIDLTEHGQEVTLCVGGKGGRGNFHFRTATNQVPQEREMGTDGSEGIYYLELRRIADAGLVGFPNAGKSTLLGKLSAKKPKVASYPFTTLTPQIGVVPLGGHVRCTVADIPGLIEGAHENRGLGHEFLRHITRCRVLLFVVDMAGSEGRDPIEDIQTLRTEIKMYDEELSKFPWMVIANKMDLEASTENLEFFKQRFPKVKIVSISADKEEGLDKVKDALEEIMEKQENA